MATVGEAGPSDTADDTTSGKYQSSNTSAIQVFLHSCFNCTHLYKNLKKLKKI